MCAPNRPPAANKRSTGDTVLIQLLIDDLIIKDLVFRAGAQIQLFDDWRVGVAGAVVGDSVVIRKQLQEVGGGNSGKMVFLSIRTLCHGEIDGLVFVVVPVGTLEGRSRVHGDGSGPIQKRKIGEHPRIPMSIDLSAVADQSSMDGRNRGPTGSHQVRRDKAGHGVNVLHGKNAGVGAQAVTRTDDRGVGDICRRDGIIRDADRRSAKVGNASDGDLLLAAVVGYGIVRSLRFHSLVDCYRDAIQHDIFRVGNNNGVVDRR